MSSSARTARSSQIDQNADFDQIWPKLAILANFDQNLIKIDHQMTNLVRPDQIWPDLTKKPRLAKSGQIDLIRSRSDSESFR